MNRFLMLLLVGAMTALFSGCVIHNQEDDGFRARASMPGAEVDVDIDD